MLRPMALALALIAATLAPAMAATGPVTEEEAHAIGVDAYLYFYPLVTMDITRKQSPTSSPARRSARPDEHVRQRPGVSACRHARSSCGQLRHALFHRAGSI